MLEKNQDIELEIDGITAEGSGVGHYDGIAVFVPNTAVGDLIQCHIVKTKKTYAFGKAMAVLKASKDRVAPDCEAAAQCGGCCFRHISYDAELQIKQQRVEDAFQRIAHLDVPFLPIIGSAEQKGYRNKAQYPVGFSAAHVSGRRLRNAQMSKSVQDKGLQIGFYARGSHRIIPNQQCSLQPKVFENILDIVRSWILRYNIATYDEVQHKGMLRHIYIRQGYHTGQIMVCLVVNGNNIPHTFPLVETLRNSIPGFTTLVANYNQQKTNVIMGEKSEALYGDGFIEDTLLDCTFRISPRSFYQVNTAQAEVLYTKAAEMAGLLPDADAPAPDAQPSPSQDGPILLDLYCGIGTIGLTMASHVRRLYGVEIIPEAIEDAKLNAAINHIDNAEFICGDAAAAAARLKADGVKADIILVDPPRKGLDAQLVETIAEFDPERLVYVSCDPATLARDCALFKDHGYTVQKVQPIDMFPRTAHVETVVLMSRKEK